LWLFQKDVDVSMSGRTLLRVRRDVIEKGLAALDGRLSCRKRDVD
jgi:hypothetical protein